MLPNKTILALAMVLFLSVTTRAQQPQTQPLQQSGGGATPVQPIDQQINTGNSGAPAPAGRGLFVGYAPQNDNGTAQTEPDDRFLSGVESFGLGMVHSFTTLLDPSAFLTESVDNGDVPGRWNSATSVGGSLAFIRDWERSQVTLQYTGVKSFYVPNITADYFYQNLSAGESIHFGRWGFLMRDDLIYSPGSNFSGFLAGGIAPAGGVAAGSPLQPGIAPAETIFTGFVDTLNNTAVAQVSYSHSRRSAVTFSGAYGMLHYLQPGYVDSGTISGNVGYNYALNRFNSIAGSYSFGQSIFNNSNVKTTTHAIQGSFGRKISERLALQLSAGPQFIISQNGLGKQSVSQWFWTANGAVTYGPRPKHISYSAAYFHGYTSGSGVFYGTESDTATGTVRVNVGRAWIGSINGGYASNRSFVTLASGATRFDNWFGGANLSRSLGPQIVFDMAYQYTQQRGNGACPVAACAITPNRHGVFVRLQWHPWPARIQ